MMEQLVPKLRFPEFLENWSLKKIKTLATINPKPKEIPNEFIYIDLESVEKGFLKIEKKIKKTEAPSRASRTIETNDILFQTVRPYQRNNYLFKEKSNNYVASTGYAQLRTNEIPEFIYQLMFTDNFNDEIMNHCTGTSYPAIKSTDLGNISISIPSLEEQTKIADFLGAVDKQLEILNQKKEKLNTYKKGVMQQLFSKQLRFKEDNGNDFPEWEEKTLGEVFKIQAGKDYKHLTSGNIPVYGTGGIMLYVNDYLFNGISVCIGRKGTIDKPMLLNGKFWTVDTLFYTKDFKDCIPEFIYQLFLNINWRSYNEASGVPSLSTKIINRIEIKLPSLAEQKKIVGFLSGIDKQIETVSSQIQKTENYKKGLLQQMFV